MRRGLAVLTGLAVLAIIAPGVGSDARVLAGSAPFARPAAPTTTTSLPDPTTTAPPTTVPDPTTTVAPRTATAQIPTEAVVAATGRLCAPSTVPPGAASSEIASLRALNLAYSASPGGPTAGHVVNPWGGPTARPVLNQVNGWVEIPLYPRPNGSVGWVPSDDVVFSTTPYRIVVSICARSLTLFDGANAVYSSPVGVGMPRSPTPVGLTYVDAIVTTPRRDLGTYGPTVLMLGTHSNTYTDFDGGDGVVAIHGYPSDPASTRGVAASHGCIRASPTTISTIKVVPAGTPVDVIA